MPISRVVGSVVLGIVALAVLAYIATVAYVFFVQRDLQYDRDGKMYEIGETSLTRSVLVHIPTEGGAQLTGWYAAPVGDKPVILYFRGKTGSFSREYERYERFEADGYGYLAFDYRGFPGSPGELTEEHALADSLAAFDWLKQKGLPIVLWGRSLGSGPATFVASQRGASALLLESPFLSAVDVAQRSFWYLPVSWIMLDQYPVKTWIRGVDEPVFVAHGAVDPAIPVDNGKAVFALAPHPAGLWIDPEGDHDNLWEHGLWTRAKDFFASVPAGP